MAKKKRRFFQIGPADGGSEDVADEFRRLVGLAVLQLRLLDEVIVGAGDGVAVVFVERAVEIVGAALGDESDLSAGGTAAIGVVVGGGDAKFLHGVEGDGEHGSEGVAAGLVIDVDAIESDVALVAARAVDRAAAAIEVLVDVGAVAGVGDAGLKREEIRDVAGFDGQLLDLVLVEGGAQRGVGGIEGHGLGGNFDGLGGGADVQSNVGGTRGIDQQLDVLLLVLAEARCFDGQQVGAGRKRKKFVRAGAGGFGLALQCLSRVGENYVGADNRGAGFVQHGAAQRRCARLRVGDGRREACDCESECGKNTESVPPRDL